MVMLSTNTDTGLELVALCVKCDVVYGDFHFRYFFPVLGSLGEHVRLKPNAFLTQGFALYEVHLDKIGFRPTLAHCIEMPPRIW